jgi:zeaxanthin glucosyltransferase
MQFAFVCPPFAGHLHPMQALGQRLEARGHRVTFVGIEDVRLRIEAAGFDALALGAQTHPPGALDRLEARLSSLPGLWPTTALRAVIADVAQMTDMLCREAPQAVQRAGADAIVADQLEAAGGLIAQRLKLPHISVANALMIDREPYVPPPFTGWRYARTRWARERNLGGWRVSDWLMRGVGAVIARWSQAWQLRSAPQRVDQCLAPHLQVGQLWPQLDFPREALAPAFAYTGPLRVPSSDDDATLPPLPARAFAFISLGTLQGGRFALLARLAQACRDLNLACVIAHGGRLDVAQAAALSQRGAQVHAFVPQRQVLARAALCITHGGLNTTLDALAAGVPLVLVPLAMEQAGTAQRVLRAGAGVCVRAHSGVPGLRRAIARALGSSACHAAAREHAAHAHRAGGAERAAQLIEAHARAAAV